MPTQTKITRYYKKSTNNQRRKKFYRRSLQKRSYANLKRDVHYFKRSFLQTTILGNAAYTPYLAGVNWTFNALPNYTEFANMFDRYKVTYVKLYFHLKIDPSAQAAASATFPKLYYVTDFDDSTNPTSINQLREHSNLKIKVLNPNKPVVVRVKPAVLQEVYRGLASTTYSPKWNQWIDMANVDVPLYGLKIAIDNLTNTNYAVDIDAKMWFQCKDVR